MNSVITLSELNNDCVDDSLPKCKKIRPRVIKKLTKPPPMKISSKSTGLVQESHVLISNNMEQTINKNPLPSKENISPKNQKFSLLLMKLKNLRKSDILKHNSSEQEKTVSNNSLTDTSSNVSLVNEKNLLDNESKEKIESQTTTQLPDVQVKPKEFSYLLSNQESFILTYIYSGLLCSTKEYVLSSHQNHESGIHQPLNSLTKNTAIDGSTVMLESSCKSDLQSEELNQKCITTTEIVRHISNSNEKFLQNQNTSSENKTLMDITVKSSKPLKLRIILERLRECAAINQSKECKSPLPFSKPTVAIPTEVKINTPKTKSVMFSDVKSNDSLEPIKVELPADTSNDVKVFNAEINNNLNVPIEDKVHSSKKGISEIKILKDHQKFNDVKSPKNETTGQKIHRKACYNCGGADHYFPVCPQPRSGVFCFKCGWEGVTTPKCPYCQNKAT